MLDIVRCLVYITHVSQVFSIGQESLLPIRY